MKDKRKILFVCSGNSCRSIMAEAYLKKRAAEEKLPLEVRSAGTLGIEGMTPPPETLTTLEKAGIASGGYSSTAISEDIINWADVILVMEPSHKNTVVGLVPEAEYKVFYLREFAGAGSDATIPDPIGRSLGFYEVSFEIIRDSVEGFVKWLKEGKKE